MYYIYSVGLHLFYFIFIKNSVELEVFCAISWLLSRFVKLHSFLCDWGFCKVSGSVTFKR